MNKFSKIIISAAASTLALSSADQEHICASNPMTATINLGGSISHSFDSSQDIFGMYLEAIFAMASCSSIEGSVLVSGGYSKSSEFDSGSLGSRVSSVGDTATANSVGLKMDKANGLVIKSLGITAQVGKNFCFAGDYADVRQRRGQDCLCSHANVGLGAILLWDKFETDKDIKAAAGSGTAVTNLGVGSNMWVSSVAKDLGVGIAGSFIWSSESGMFAVAPEAGIFAQVWNSSKVDGYNKTAGDTSNAAAAPTMKTIDVTRSKFRPIIGAGIPVMIRVSDNIDACVKVSALWTMRSIKDGDSDATVAGFKDMLIEDRISGAVGIGIAYSQR